MIYSDGAGGHHLEAKDSAGQILPKQCNHMPRRKRSIYFFGEVKFQSYQGDKSGI